MVMFIESSCNAFQAMLNYYRNHHSKFGIERKIQSKIRANCYGRTYRPTQIVEKLRLIKNKTGDPDIIANEVVKRNMDLQMYN